MNYDELKKIYNEYFSLDFLGKDINNKLALISLTCYLSYKLRAEPIKILKKIAPKASKELLTKIAIICSDFGYGCISFPTFGIPDKEIPSKIKKILDEHFPF